MFGVRDKIYAVVILLLIAAAGVQTYRLQSSELYISEYKQQIQQELIRSYQRVRDVERQSQWQVDALGRDYQRSLDEITARERAIADGLRNDTIRLRSHWRGCEATNRAIDSSRPGSSFDAEAELRNRDASHLIGNSDRADAQVIGLQDTIDYYLELINGRRYYTEE